MLNVVLKPCLGIKISSLYVQDVLKVLLCLTGSLAVLNISLEKLQGKDVYMPCQFWGYKEETKIK